MVQIFPSLYCQKEKRLLTFELGVHVNSAELADMTTFFLVAHAKAHLVLKINYIVWFLVHYVGCAFTFMNE